MSLAIFPRLSGLTFDVKMTPNFKTNTATLANGNEVRNSLQQYPLWDFELAYEWLPNRTRGRKDLETICGFFLARQGSFESFLFPGPEVPPEDMTILGVGNGTTSAFTLVKTTGGFSEIAGGIPSVDDVQVYLDGVYQVPTAYTLVDNRIITLNNPPAAGVVVQAVYTPMYRTRFLDDNIQFNQFMTKLWEIQQLDLKGVFQ